MISRMHILTSASCSSGKEAHAMRIVLGEEDYQAINTNRELLKVDKIIVHPNYDPFNSHIHNLAILQLSNEITMTSNVNEIGLGDGTETTSENLFISGWGKPPNQRSTSILNLLYILQTNIL